MKGVRQGNTLSLAMFTSTMEAIFKRINIKTDVKINGERLSNLRFAEGEEHLENLLKDLNVEGKRDGLKMNKKKLKSIFNRVAKQQHRRGILIDGEQLEEVNRYKYLGRLLTPENEMAKDIDQTITAGWRRFGQYNTFLKDQKMPICLKREKS